MTDALEFLSQVPHPNLGIPHAIDLDAKSPIWLREMSRTNLAQLFGALGYRRGVEVGVARGVYSEVLLDNVPGLELFCVDPWELLDGYSEEQYVRHEGLMRETYQDAIGRLAHRNTHILKMTSREAVRLFAEGELDFCYIDGDHRFQEVTHDIHKWGQVVRPGGIVAGHDWARFKRPKNSHVKAVVNAWTFSHGIHPWFVVRKDSYSSWFWVKS